MLSVRLNLLPSRLHQDKSLFSWEQEPHQFVRSSFQSHAQILHGPQQREETIAGQGSRLSCEHSGLIPSLSIGQKVCEELKHQKGEGERM